MSIFVGAIHESSLTYVQYKAHDKGSFVNDPYTEILYLDDSRADRVRHSFSDIHSDVPTSVE